MIIEFDSSIIDSDAPEGEVRFAIESVCAAVRRGYHFLFSGRAVLDYLLTFPGITKESRVVIDGVRSSYATTAGFLSSFGYRVIIRSDIPACRQVAGGRWEVPLSSIVDHGVQPVNLLGENSRDAELYTEAARHYVINNKLGPIQIHGVPRNGNGAGTSQELRRYIEQRREWVVCLTDSDRCCPADSLGDIAQMCAGEVRRGSWVALHAHVSGRTIENVLPHNLVADAVPPELQERVSNVSRLHHLHGSEVINHANLKDGVHAKWIRNLGENSASRNFWEPIAVAEGIDCADCCLPQAQCGRDSVCQRYVLRGFGSALSEHVQRHLEGISPHKAAERAKSSFNSDLWNAIGKVVCLMAMAPKPSRS
ncbi:hypothetical protein [Cupriavidus alkaliphilus]|uniref:hypothetical protein n=1 Tax=Cupriavidus alkaliphilus TaxID=942866 RepID=UPI00160CF181|nr:hypothetical protein [Cupriavidus alkaliphilus]MBB2918107.1 hypothetical protein [Cupriavidus alkaliphilus]